MPERASRITHQPGSSAHPNLPLGRPRDAFEREADRVADQVMRAPGAERAGDSVRPLGPVGTPSPVASAGQALDGTLRGFFERRLGRDLSAVRIHSDRSAEESAHAMGARAYAAGSHIVFGRGQYAPASSLGRHLIAHELAHVIQQASPHAAAQGDARNHSGPKPVSVGLHTAGPRIQRNLVPPDEIAKAIEKLDAKLADPRLPDDERFKLLEERHRLYEYLRHVDERLTLPVPEPVRPKATPKFQPKTQDPKAAPAAIEGDAKLKPATGGDAKLKPATGGDAKLKPATGGDAKLKPVPSKGSPGDPQASAKKLASKDAKPIVGAPTTPYVDPGTTPANPAEKIKAQEESTIGKRLNEMAVGGDLGDIRRVEGRRRIPGAASPDYAFQRKDRSYTYGDLYSPAASTPVDNVVMQLIKKKSAQGEIAVLHLTGVARPLEYAHGVADALIITPNHGITQLIVFSDYKRLLTRSLTVDGAALAATRKRVLARLEQQSQNERLARPEPKPEPPKRAPVEPPKLSRGQIEQLRRANVQQRLAAMMGQKGLFNDPRALSFEKPTGTGISTHGAMEGAVQIGLSVQLESTRNAQLQKALNAWERLQPKLDALRARGYSVTVVAVAQVPKQPDVAAYVTGVGDPGQVVYFETMYMARAEYTRRSPVVADGPRQTTMGPAPTEDPVLSEANHSPNRFDEPEWVKRMQQTYEIYGSAGSYKPPRPGFRYEVGTITLPHE